MAKFLKRIGCLKTRFDFEVLLASLELPSSLAWSGTMKISLKKGKRHVETKISHKIDLLNPSNPINESLIFPATLFLSKKTNKYLEKPVNFTSFYDNIKKLPLQGSSDSGYHKQFRQAASHPSKA